MKKIDVLLPDRIGDSVLSIPAVVCLKQLIEKYSNESYTVRLISSSPMTPIFKALNLFEVKQLTPLLKLHSYFYNSDVGVCLYTSSKSMFYHSKSLCGEVYPYKKRIKFDVDMPYLDLNNMHKILDKKFLDFMHHEKGLAYCAIRYFGICLESGFTPEQIMETYSMDKIEVGEFSDWKNPILDEKYFVYCMEAAYGTKNDKDRRWEPEYHFETAQEAAVRTGYKCVFIGIDNSIELPQNPNFVDLRKKLSLVETAKLIQYSQGYVGNDTGPLHLANLFGKKSMACYFRTASLTDYAPLFADLNLKIVHPKTSQEMIDSLDFVFS